MSPKVQRQRPAPESHLVRRAEPIRTGGAEPAAVPLPDAAPVTPPAPPVPPPRAVRDVMAPRRRGGAPEAASAIAFTIRYDPDEAYEVDALVLALRRQLGWRNLDKSAFYRALSRIAHDNADVQRLALEELRRTGP